MIVIGLMFVLLIFAGAAARPGGGQQKYAAIVLIWFFTLSTVVVISLLIYNYFFALNDALKVGNAIVMDGGRYYDQGAFSLSRGLTERWNSDNADLGVFRTSTSRLPHFFLMNNQGVYGKLEQGQIPAHAGIVDMNTSDFESVREAPATGYTGTDYEPFLGHVYCVRTRDGSHYAKIKVVDMEDDRIAFDFAYQPAQYSRRLAQ